jgi:hypothetical protein
MLFILGQKAHILSRNNFHAESQRLSAFTQNFDVLIVTEQAASPLSGQFPAYALFLQHMK